MIDDLLQNIDNWLDSYDGNRDIAITNAIDHLQRMSPHRQKFESVFSRMLLSLENDLNRRPGTTTFQTLGPIAVEVDALSHQIDFMMRQTSPLYASDESLDLIGRAINLPRREASAALIIVETRDNNGEPFTASTGVTANWVHPAMTPFDENVMFSNERSEHGLSYWRCSTLGTIGNIEFGNLVPTTSLAGWGSLIIMGIQEIGTERENDNNYRMRILRRLGLPSFGGNVWQYVEQLGRIQGVGGSVVYRAWLGGLTTKVVITDQDVMPVPDGFLEYLKSIIDPFLPMNYVDDDGVEQIKMVDGMGHGDPELGAPIGHKVTFVTPLMKPVSVSVDIQLRFGREPGQVNEIFQNVVNRLIENVRRSYVEEWEDSIFRGDSFDLMNIDPETNPYGEVNQRHYLVISRASIISALEQTRMTSRINLDTIRINSELDDLVIMQHSRNYELPFLENLDINYI